MQQCPLGGGCNAIPLLLWVFRLRAGLWRNTVGTKIVADLEKAFQEFVPENYYYCGIGPDWNE